MFDLVKPKVGAENELVINKPVSCQLRTNKCSFLSQALGVTKFTNITEMILKSDLSVIHTYLSLLNKSSCLAAALSVTTILAIIAMNVVTIT
jgi:hypothetical protein